VDESPVRNLSEELYSAIARDGLFDLPPAALARLALSQAARELADSARSLVPTASDRYAESGGFIDHAHRLVAAAQEVLERAVIYERERGRSWEDVGEALGITRQSAHERFAEAEERWHYGLDHPYTLPTGNSIASSNLPDGADSPRDYMRWLDEWCERHTEPADGATDRAHQVSAGLVRDDLLTVQLISAVTGQSNRLVRDHGHDPVAERTFWERKVRLAERLAAGDPGDPKAQESLAAARAKLDELRAAANTAP
jgi:hypothetical protein